MRPNIITKVYKFRVQCMLERTTLDRLQITQEAESGAGQLIMYIAWWKVNLRSGIVKSTKDNQVVKQTQLL